MYIKLAFPFWAIQPVFHFYDIHYFFYSPQVIMTKLPEKNKFVNLNNIVTKQFSELTKYEITDFTLFICMHYLQNKENKYQPKNENIVPYFSGHNSKTFVSRYFKTELLLDRKTQRTIQQSKLIGIITSRPIHIRINNSSKNITKFDAYYVDYLCIDKSHRKSNKATQLIQTLEYLQRHTNKNISVSLFKREEELTAITTLILY
jgi:hypothetical protein